MGLLSKAEGIKKPVEIAMGIPDKDSAETQELDERGKALIGRILRIPPGPAVPYTALSLLKAYGSFQAGICFALENGSYINYTSVGLGIDKITIPKERIYSPERASSVYFQFSAKEKPEINLLDTTLDL